MRKTILAIVAAVFLSLSLAIPAATATSHTTHSHSVAQSDPNNFPACFGDKGVQIPGKRAYECAYGHTYWSVNLNTIQWDNHPPDGLLWIHADTLIASTLTNPPNPFRYFIVTIAGPFGGCRVIDAGVGEEPTECAEDGGTGPTQSMTNAQAASYENFEQVMEDPDAHIPYFAWRDAPGT